MLERRESDIVLAAQNGNRNAFGQLVQRYQNLVTSIAFSKTGDLQRSEDVAQQAFLVAWEKRQELRDPGKFGGWLSAITKNLTLNSNRKSKRLDRAAQSLAPQLEPTTLDHPGESISKVEQQELLWASLKNIPEEYREPLVLYYREDKSVAQVAELMDLSVDAVKQRLSRGRAMLKSEVEQFVEDLLGASKPKASFVSAVMVALPAAASSTVAKGVIQGGTAFGVKTMLGKLGLLASGPFWGAMGGVLGAAGGVAGAWYGTKAAEKYATSEDEKKLLWWFFKIILSITALFTVLSIATAFLTTAGPYRFVYVVGATVLYTAILTGLIIYFINRQKGLHDKYGKPDYPSEVGDAAPASPKEFRFTLVASTVGCWAWLIVLAAVNLNWIVIAVSIITMLGHLAWRIVGAESQTTLPAQLRFQASNVLSIMLLTAILVVAAGFLGVTYEPVPNWGLALFVFIVGWLCAAALWFAANKAEEKIANSKK